MYGQLYHRTISRELPEPQRNPRGRARRGGHKRDGRGGACGKQARPAPQGAKPVRPCRMSHAAAARRKARSVGPQAAAGERPGGAGNIFAPCVISGSSTRKRGLGGKIRAPCIPNRRIAPENECMGRGCCHSDLEKHAFRADVARKGAFFAHSAKNGCIRHDSCQPGPRCRRNARGRRGWRAVGAMRVGLSKRGRRNGAETERHTGAWVQWSRAARCRRCDEGQGSAEIAGRRGRRSGRGKRMDTVQERGARWTRGSAGV